MKTSFFIFCLVVCLVTLSVWCHKHKGRKGKPSCAGCKGCCERARAVRPKCDACGQLTTGFDEISVKLEEITEKLALYGKECPPDWLKFQCSCYFVQKEKVPVTQEAAMERCKSHHSGSSLMIIDSFDEFSFMKTYLNSIYLDIEDVTAHSWVIAGSEEEGVVRWTPTGPVADTSTFIWGPGEPSSDLSKCLAYRRDDGFDIGDVKCSEFRRQYICEM